jgi:hypothetical protein
MKEVQSFLENPFKVEGISTIAYVTKVDEKSVIDPETGEVYLMRKMPKNQQHLHDSKVYVKLFQDNSDLLMKLPHASIKILLYGMCRVRPLSEIVYLNVDDCMVNCGFKSPTSYREGIKALIESNIIARKIGSSMEYWLNPNIFFNGNRLRLIK